MNKLKLIASLAVLFLCSCQGESDKKGAKGNWSKEERHEFMNSCISSAKKSYEARNQQPDSAVITTLCKCSGEMLEKKYTYSETEKLPPEEGKAIMMEAAKKCLPQK